MSALSPVGMLAALGFLLAVFLPMLLVGGGGQRGTAPASPAAGYLFLPALRLGQTGEQLTSLLVVGSIVVGLTFLVTSWRDIKLEPGVVSFSEGMKWRLFFENPGVIFFCLLALFLMASYVL